MTRTLHRLMIGTASAALLAAATPVLLPAPGFAVQEAAEQTESARLNAWFDRIEQEDLARSPLTKAYRGIIDEDYGRWNDVSDAFAVETFELGQARLSFMRENFDFEALDASAQLSWRLFEYRQEQAAINQPFRRHGYVFNQMGGPHSQVPVVMTTIHRINSARTAEQWIERAGGVPELDRKSVV